MGVDGKACWQMGIAMESPNTLTRVDEFTMNYGLKASGLETSQKKSTWRDSRSNY